ncbi:MAG: hypothetical protein ACRDGL_09525, partial [Candidatus Limnocylindrales bacterium]
ATALLQSSVTLTNPFFLLRSVGGHPCDQGTPAASLSIAANHGGEYVDLLSLATSGTRIIDGSDPTGPGTTVAGLTPANASVAAAASTVTSVSAWRSGGSAARTFREVVSLLAQASTVQLVAAAGGSVPIGGISLDLKAAPGVAITAIAITGRVAEVDFTQLGLKVPRLRLTIAGGAGSFEPVSGGVRVIGRGAQLRLLITALTASDRPVAGLGALCPSRLVGTYGVAAVVLKRDPAYPARAARMTDLGFTQLEDFGAYVVLTRPGLAGGS